MIRLVRQNLHERVSNESPSWKARATAIVQRNLIAGKQTATRKERIWRDIKMLMAETQLNKCPYCERRPEKSAVEWDVDHYRPQNRVRNWMGTAEIKDRGETSDGGYFLLAYDVSNFIATCKPCNEAYKRDFFPITAPPRALRTMSARILRGEGPLLLNPVDSTDDDPECLIGFVGVLPYVRTSKLFQKKRAICTIEILGLAYRENLITERSWVLFHLWNSCELTASDSVERQKIVSIFVSNSAPHANCARSFLRLYYQNREAAQKHFEFASKMISADV